MAITWSVLKLQSPDDDNNDENSKWLLVIWLNGHNLANFEATTFRFCKVIDLNDDDDVDDNDDDDNGDHNDENSK